MKNNVNYFNVEVDVLLVMLQFRHFKMSYGLSVSLNECRLTVDLNHV